METNNNGRLWHILFSGVLAVILGIGLAESTYAQHPVSPKIYLSESKSSDVAVIDTKEDKVIKRIPVRKGAHGVAITPDGTRVFVSSDESNVITVIDATTDEVIGVIPTGKAPHGLIVGTDGKHIYATVFGDDQILEINTQTLKVERTFAAPSPHNLALSPDNRTLYFAAQKPGKTGIGKIDLEAGKLVQLVNTQTVPRSLNVSPDGSKLCATQFDRNEVEVFMTNPFEKFLTVEVGASPHHTIFTPDGKIVLVGNQISNDLALIDTKTWKVVGKIAVGQKPHWIAPTSDSKYAYVTDEASNEVSFVDLEEKKLERTIVVGVAPRKIVIQPGTVPEDEESEQHSENSVTSKEEKHVIVKLEGYPPRFIPATVVVVAETTIDWINEGKIVHTVTDENASWDSGSLRPGEKFSKKFEVKGTFPYYCIPHRSMGMVGTIVVK